MQQPNCQSIRYCWEAGKVKTLIRLRAELSPLFTGKRNASKYAWAVVERELNVPLPISKIIKKWNNLLQEYKAIKLSEEPKRREWPFFNMMDVYFSDQVNDPTLRLFSSTKRFDSDTLEDANFDEELMSSAAAAAIVAASAHNNLNNINLSSLTSNNPNQTSAAAIVAAAAAAAAAAREREDRENRRDNRDRERDCPTVSTTGNNGGNGNGNGNGNINSTGSGGGSGGSIMDITDIMDDSHNDSIKMEDTNYEPEVTLNTNFSSHNTNSNSMHMTENLINNNNNNNAEYDDCIERGFEGNFKNINQKLLHQMNEHHNIDQYLLSWRGFHGNMCKGFHSLQRDGQMVDVTIAAGGKIFKAHKLVLSVCSPYFQRIFIEHPSTHPILFMTDVNSNHMAGLLDFMYSGQVNVKYEDLQDFLKVAEALQVKGLHGESTNDNDNEREQHQAQQQHQLQQQHQHIMQHHDNYTNYSSKTRVQQQQQHHHQQQQQQSNDDRNHKLSAHYQQKTKIQQNNINNNNNNNNNNTTNNNNNLPQHSVQSRNNLKNLIKSKTVLNDDFCNNNNNVNTVNNNTTTVTNANANSNNNNNNNNNTANNNNNKMTKYGVHQINTSNKMLDSQKYQKYFSKRKIISQYEQEMSQEKRNKLTTMTNNENNNNNNNNINNNNNDIIMQNIKTEPRYINDDGSVGGSGGDIDGDDDGDNNNNRNDDYYSLQSGGKIKHSILEPNIVLNQCDDLTTTPSATTGTASTGSSAASDKSIDCSTTITSSINNNNNTTVLTAAKTTS